MLGLGRDKSSAGTVLLFELYPALSTYNNEFATLTAQISWVRVATLYEQVFPTVRMKNLYISLHNNLKHKTQSSWAKTSGCDTWQLYLPIIGFGSFKLILLFFKWKVYIATLFRALKPMKIVSLCLQQVMFNYDLTWVLWPWIMVSDIINCLACIAIDSCVPRSWLCIVRFSCCT